MGKHFRCHYYLSSIKTMYIYALVIDKIIKACLQYLSDLVLIDKRSTVWLLEATSFSFSLFKNYLNNGKALGASETAWPANSRD
jgi:hypothetical protein